MGAGRRSGTGRVGEGKILVTGAHGLLGTETVARARARGLEAVGFGRDHLDVTDSASVHGEVASLRPEAIVHCAAYTAVDRAESEPGLARLVNRDGAENVATAAAGVGAALVYVSTDYVFDGRQRTPYLPSAAPAPLSVYGRTKLEGEEVVRRVCPDALVVRTSWLYGSGRGFAPTILARARELGELRVVDDQSGRPTWAGHAAEAILDLLVAGATGVWHVADGGHCTPLELAKQALQMVGVRADVQAVSSIEYGAPALRPAYSVLDLHATEAFLGRTMPEWREGLRMELATGARSG